VSVEFVNTCPCCDEHGRVIEAASANGDPFPGGQSLMDRLIDKRAIGADSAGNVRFIFLVSAVPTGHKALLDDGRSCSTTCAVDDPGAAFTFEQDTTVTSRCSECGQEVFLARSVGADQRHAPQTHQILHVDLNQVENRVAKC
jgi:hypothetical protein